MTIQAKLIVTGVGAILVFDALSAWLSGIGKFPYVLCLPATVAIYFWATYRVAKYVNVGGAITFGAFMGFVDVTLGYKIADGLGADPQDVYKHLTFNRWLTIVFWVMLYGAMMGLIAYLIAAYRKKRQQHPF